MSLIPTEKLEFFNSNLLNETPEEIIRFALGLSGNPMLTTSFGRFSEVIIRAVHSCAPKIKVLWCDTGYNTHDTYAHSQYLAEKYKLNLEVVSPRYTRAYTEFHYGLPGLDNPQHKELTELLKLKPIKTAFARIKPDLWFTNLRKGQTSFRDGLDVLSISPDGILKVSPFYHWSDEQMQQYIAQWKLKENQGYFDPIKALSKRECGIHFSN